MTDLFDDVIIKTVGEDTEGEVKPSCKKPEKGGKRPEKGSMSVHVAFVMDHSGSMGGQKQLALENYNEQIAKLKQESGDIDTWVNLIEFDNRIIVVHEGLSLNDIKPVTDYWTNGTTSLNDAIFKGIKLLEKGMKNDSSEDKSALMVIMTDGYENSSVEFAGNKGRDAVKAEIQKLEKTDEWTFTFMGADIDVQNIAVAGFGMNVGNTFAFNANSRGYKMSGDSVKSGVTAYYSARMAGQTSLKNFHDNNSNTGDVDLNEKEDSKTAK